MNREYTTNIVLIQSQSERQVDLLGNAGTTVLWIAPFHPNDGINDFSGWPIWTTLIPATW